MKTNLKFILEGVACLLCTSFTACEAGMSGEDVPFEEYVYHVTEGSGEEVFYGWWFDGNYFINTPWGEGNIVVVDSASELRKYVSEGHNSSIDFSKKTLLLIGGGAHSSPVFSYVRSLKLTKRGNYVLNVEIGMPLFVHGFGYGWNKALLIDKIGAGSDVELKVTVKK